MAINYTKIDTILSRALQNSRDPSSKEIDVFITTCAVPDSQQAAHLEQLGVKPLAFYNTFTARLSQNDIETLSNEPWVKIMHGNMRMQPFSGA